MLGRLLLFLNGSFMVYHILNGDTDTAFISFIGVLFSLYLCE